MKSSIARGEIKTRSRRISVSSRDNSLRRDLAMLWVAQTLRDMVIIGLSDNEMAEVVNMMLDRWCTNHARKEEETPSQ
ncbi:MAG: hypothetical protein GIX02_11205 [Candidatus Eremiobacteraeota bacterium]|nr:hypothetical protein [Candidatus Eremiobacteraeota bacterium]